MALNVLLKLFVLFITSVLFVESSFQIAKINDKHWHLRLLLFFYIWGSCKIIVPWPVWPWWYSLLLYFGSCFLWPHPESSHFSTLGYLRYFQLSCPGLSSFFSSQVRCILVALKPVLHPIESSVFFSQFIRPLLIFTFIVFHYPASVSWFTGLTLSLSNSLACLPSCA